MSEYLINGNIYFVVLLMKGFFSEFPSEQPYLSIAVFHSLVYSCSLTLYKSKILSI